MKFYGRIWEHGNQKNTLMYIDDFRTLYNFLRWKFDFKRTRVDLYKAIIEYDGNFSIYHDSYGFVITNIDLIID